MQIVWRSVMAGLLFATIDSTLAHAGKSPEFLRGREAWQQGKYLDAVGSLLKARAQPNGRTAETDYMLGTSGCRISGRALWGKKYLSWTLNNYALDPPSREVVQRALQHCDLLGSESPSSLVINVVLAQTPPSAWASGKVMDLGNQLVASRPASQKRRLTEAEVAERRIPVGQTTEVEDMIRKVSGLKNIAVCDDLAVATDLTSKKQLQTACVALSQYTSFLRNKFALTPSPVYSIVYLINDATSLLRLADKIHQLKLDRRTLGYAVREDSSVVTLAPGLGLGTAQHELFHLLVRVDFGDIPTWFDEGVAAVYEVSQRCGDDYYGLTNWRTEVVKRFGMSSLATLIEENASPFDDPTGEPHYGEDVAPSAKRIARDMATARFLALYLQEHRILGQVFAALRDRDPGLSDDAPKDSIRILEGILNKPLPEIQVDLDTWYASEGRSLKYGPSRCRNASWGPAAQAPDLVAFDPGPPDPAARVIPKPSGPGSPVSIQAKPAPSPVPPPVPPRSGCSFGAEVNDRWTPEICPLLIGITGLWIRRRRLL